MDGSVDKQLPAKGEDPLYWHAFREFKGVYTRSDRTAMPEDNFYDLENLMPIGPANMHVVPDISAVLYNFAGDTIYFYQYAQVATVQYLIAFATNGKVFSYNLSNSVVAQINIGTPLSGAGSRMAQWMNQYVLFIDSSGYYSWDGTTFTLRNGANQPATGVDIAVYAGRVWVASGRLIVVTSVYDTGADDPTGNTAWTAAEGSSFVNMTDPTLTGNIVRLYSCNGYLYIIGDTCVYALSDVYVPAGASPPTPVFTITNIQAIIGTDQPTSIFPYNRSLMFANRYGAWAVNGVDAQRMSEDIDGTWQYLSFSPAISGGQCIVENILCAAFLLQRSNDPVFGSTCVVGMWFDGKWWFGNFGSITFIASAFLNNVPTLFVLIGNKLYTLYTNTASYPATNAVTPLWAMEDPISIKEIVRAGLELVTFVSGGNVTVNVDGTGGSSSVAVSAVPGTLTFLGAGSIPISFLGAGSVPIVWTVGSYTLYQGPPPGVFSHYIGMTITTSGVSAQLSSFFMDYKKRARWV